MDGHDPRLTSASSKLEAIKNAERVQIADELRAGMKPPEQIAREQQPWAQALGRDRARLRLDLVQSIA